MGYRDYKLMLSDSQAVSADAASSYWLDTELTNPGWEAGNPLGVVINVETAPGGTTGVEFVICHKSSATPTITDVTLQTTRVLNADLTKGSEIVVVLPVGVQLDRHIGIYYNLITGDETAFVCSAYFTPIQVAGGKP